MKKILSGLLVLALFAGCGKDAVTPSCSFTGCESYNPCGIVAPTAEVQQVQAYLNANSLTATQHCSGLFYIIDAMGTGASATACSKVNVTYTGKFTNGTQFDTGTIDLCMGNVILGWTNGVPLVKEGGQIRLFIPPTLGYGAQDYNGIPGNSVLVFDVKVNKVY